MSRSIARFAPTFLQIPTMRLRHALWISFAVLVAMVASPPEVTATTEDILHLFAEYPNGVGPQGLVEDEKGNFYGVAGGGAYGAGIVFRLTIGDDGEVIDAILYNFTGGTDGRGPLGVVLIGNKIYGFASGGGTDGYGTFFELTPTTGGEWKEKVLYNFDNYLSAPDSAPSVDKRGNIFGVNCGDSACFEEDNDDVFELTRSQSGEWSYNVIATFGSGGDLYCNGGFAFDPSNNLYGTCRFGGGSDDGIVFELSPSTGGTWTETTIYSFIGGTDGLRPTGGLIFDDAGNLYGSTDGGGDTYVCGPSGGCGTVYELSLQANESWTLTTLYNFGAYDGPGSVQPSPVIFDNVGNLLGTTGDDGLGKACYNYGGCGMIFELSPSGNGQWNANILYNFSSARGEGSNPSSGLIRGPGGRFYGTTISGGFGDRPGTVFELTQDGGGQWITRFVYDFPTTDGYASQATLIEDSAGNLYGTTREGGIYGGGTVFELTPAAGGGWTEQVLHNFNPKTYLNGTLLMDFAGNLYGTAESGDIFELLHGENGTWKEKVLATIPEVPHGLVFDAAGNLYGTTTSGGTQGWGSVFELSPGANGTWTEAVLYSFLGPPSDGASPKSGVVFDVAGNLYGTTYAGGGAVNQCIPRHVLQSQGCGTVYKLSRNGSGGWSETVLYSFGGPSFNFDGAFPYAGVVLDSSGNIYGTTNQGGANACHFPGAPLTSCGTVFELSPGANGQWTESILHSFEQSKRDGSLPNGIVFDSGGNLYGTTEYGGDTTTEIAIGFGTAFELSPTAGEWTERILHSFGQPPDGGYPGGTPLLDPSGDIFGTTAGNATSNVNSVVFELRP